MARTGGGSGKLLALLVVLLAALGGANYLRNLRAEEAVPRPYQSYSDAEIEALVEAYRTEAESLDRRLEDVRKGRVAPSGGTLIGDRVEDYERARRKGERVRGLAREAADREATVEELERERAIRERLDGGWRLHWERLVSIQSSSSSSKPRSSPR